VQKKYERKICLRKLLVGRVIFKYQNGIEGIRMFESEEDREK